MTRHTAILVLVLGALVLIGVPSGAQPAGQDPPGWIDLFNGKDLTGWVNVNTEPHTWRVKDGILICSGKPTGVMRTVKQYENFVLHVEWMHTEPGGNSGVFAWSKFGADGALPGPSPFPSGIEIQMLELDWPKLHMKDGVMPPLAYVHGELFGVNGVTIVPDNPRGVRSMSVENRCKPRGEWNTYDVVAVDGAMKLSVNGKFVNGFSKASQKKGYLCLESEGAEIHFRNVRIMELPAGIPLAATPAPSP